VATQVKFAFLSDLAHQHFTRRTAFIARFSCLLFFI